MFEYHGMIFSLFSAALQEQNRMQIIHPCSFSLLSILQIFPEHLVGVRPIPVSGGLEMDPAWPCQSQVHSGGYWVDPFVESCVAVKLKGNALPHPGGCLVGAEFWGIFFSFSSFFKSSGSSQRVHSE